MKTVMIINNQYMGQGDDELGNTIMGALLNKLWASKSKPDAILFYNSAVKLLSKAGGQVQALHALEEAGVDLVACGTCVSKFALEEQMACGRISGMEEILHIMLQAEKVITI